MGEYKGVLKKKLGTITIFEAADATEMKNYVQRVETREKALFSYFEIERNHGDAWRDLALALAEKHVPAYSRAKGRPPKNTDEDVTWFLLSLGVKLRDNATDAAAYRAVAKMYDISPNLVAMRLKDFKKQKTGFYKFMTAFVTRVAKDLDQEVLSEILLAGGLTDAEFENLRQLEVQDFEDHPYSSK